MAEIGTKILFIDFVRSSEHLTKCAKCAPFLLFNFRSLPIVERITKWGRQMIWRNVHRWPLCAQVIVTHGGRRIVIVITQLSVNINVWFVCVSHFGSSSSLIYNATQSNRIEAKKRTASNNNNTIGRCDGRDSDNNNNKMITRIRCEQWNSSQTLSVGLSLCFSSFVYVARSRILVFNAFGSNNFEASYVPVVSHIIIERRTTASQKKNVPKEKY